MKKLVLALTLIVGLTTLKAQEQPVVTWEGLVKKKEKSDADIADPKKSIVSKTWMSRGDTYYSCATFNTAGLYQGLPAEGNGFQNALLIIGTPDSKETTKDGEIWIYPRKKLYFTNGVLQKWEETEFIDKDALMKSAEAFIKADELDEKGTLKNKSTFKTSVAMTRDALINGGVEFYSAEKFQDAYKYMNMAYKLGEYPKMSTDTSYKANDINYYLGIMALKANMNDEAMEKFQKSIDNKYESGASYHYYAEALIQKGDSDKYIEVIKQAFEQYPQEEQLLIDMINFYLAKNQTNTVLEYLDVAIQKNPANPSYYSAKGTVYFNKFDKLFEEFTKLKEQAHENKKLAFQNRADAKISKQYEEKQNAALAEAENKSKEIYENLDLAEALFNKSLELNADFFNSAYNLGSLYLKKSRICATEADYEIKIFKNFAKSDECTASSENALKVAASKYELAHKIDPNDRDVLTTLKGIYYRLKMKEDLEKVEEKLSKLPAETKVN